MGGGQLMMKAFVLLCLLICIFLFFLCLFVSLELFFVLVFFCFFVVFFIYHFLFSSLPLSIFFVTDGDFVSCSFKILFLFCSY